MLSELQIFFIFRKNYLLSVALDKRRYGKVNLKDETNTLTSLELNLLMHSAEK